MLSDLDNFYLSKEEPTKSCLLGLRDIIKRYQPELDSTIKYGLPFFLYKGKMFCYLWVDKKTKHPYIGICDGNKIDHPDLFQGNRKRMKSYSVNPNEDIDVDTIYHIFDLAVKLY